jgi:hypothetical protein
MKFNSLLTNKLVLKVVSLLSVITVFGYLLTNNLNALIYFICLGIAIYFFNKNMVIVLGVPVILVNLYVYLYSIKEGLENSETSAIKSTKKPEPEFMDGDATINSSIDSSEPKEEETNEAFKASSKSKNKKGDKYSIDYASTVEEAYDNLNNVIGGEGIQQLTQDTQKLMNQQLKLAEAMKSMTPLIENMGPLMNQAKGLMEGMGGKEQLGSIMEMANKFKSSVAKPT